MAKDIVLEIQNVTQNISVDDVKMQKVGKKLSSMIIDKKEELLENGNIKLTLILDPKVQEIK